MYEYLLYYNNYCIVIEHNNFIIYYNIVTNIDNNFALLYAIDRRKFAISIIITSCPHPPIAGTLQYGNYYNARKT